MTALTDRRPPLQLHRRLRRSQPACLPQRSQPACFPQRSQPFWFPRHRHASSDCSLAGPVPARLAAVP